MLKSCVFVQRFIEHRNLLVPLMAAKGWDPTTGELIINQEVYDSVAQKWKRETKPPRQPEPSAQESYKAFSNLMTVSKDKITGFVTVSIRHISPSIAQQWVTWLIEDINDAMRSQDVTEAERSIAYFKEQVAATSIADLQ
ncbi:hypothetical protein N9P94_00275 [Pseudomonadales bacterium]|nr:hypothetical protein [Pseudomonadales bacterium]